MEATPQICQRWEQVKHEQDHRLQQLRQQEAQLIGQKSQVETDLELVRRDIASLMSGKVAGDAALRLYWEEQAELAKAQVDDEEPAKQKKTKDAPKVPPEG